MAKLYQVRKDLWLYLVCTGLSVVFALACGELLVRLLLPFNNPDIVKKQSLQYVPSLFSRHLLRPTQVVEHYESTADPTRDKNRQLRPIYSINAAGYRGADFQLRKPEGVTRIIVTGGSTVFDIKVLDSNAHEASDWPHLTERLLKARGFKNIEVINAGIPGHASFDTLGRLYSQLWIYEPDYVVFYGAWNDIKYFRELTPKTPLISLFKPHDDASNPFVEYQGFWDRLMSNSQLYVKFRNQYYLWKFRLGEEGVIPGSEYQDTYSSDAVKQYRLNVELIVDSSRNLGAVPILITEATLVSPNNSEEERKLIKYEYQLLTHSALIRAFNDAYEAIRSVGRKKGVPVLDLANEFNGDSELFADEVHFTAKGSEKAAIRVAEFLARELEVRSTVD
jgi:lysophospholipase L1-like esterase